MGFALNQPGMGDFLPLDESVTLPVKPSSTGSILDVLFNTGAQILQGITQPDMVKAALNKYVYGVTNPTGTQATMPAPAPSIIAGIPNTYLLIGAAAVGLILMKKR